MPELVSSSPAHVRRRPAGVLPGLLLGLGLTLLGAPAFAQWSAGGEIGVDTGVGLTSSGDRRRETVGLTLRGHLEAEFAAAPVTARLVLDPSVRLAGSGVEAAVVEPGLTEAFVRFRRGDLDLSAGLERLPLETARLSAPFRLEPLGRNGLPGGLLGVRAGLFLDAWRLRPALVYRPQDDAFGALLSVRRDFRDFDLEAHLVYLDGLRLGLGGSGLLGEVVLYGEGWLLGSPWEGRGALGASGFWGEALWTAEAAWAPAPLDPGGAARPRLLGALALPQGDAGALEATLGLAWDDGRRGAGGLSASAGLSYSYSERDRRLLTGVAVNHTPGATSYALRLGVAGYF